MDAVTFRGLERLIIVFGAVVLVTALFTGGAESAHSGSNASKSSSAVEADSSIKRSIK